MISFQAIVDRVPKPDITRFIAQMLGKEHHSRVPMAEFLIDETVQRDVLVNLFQRTWTPSGGSRDQQKAYLDNYIYFWQRMGYDYVRLEVGTGLRFNSLYAQDETTTSQTRGWTDEHGGMIRTWQEFENYSWPEPSQFDLWPLEYVANHLPEGMGLIAAHAGGLFENLSWLMSYEQLCLALFDQPDLFKAVTDRLGELFLAFYQQMVGLPNLAAIFPGDDMGFRTSTLISPAMLRKYILPWQKQYADLAHQNGMPFFLHSCGQLEKIMPDLIDTVGIDGKHSYEDAITPAEVFQAKWGERIAVLGGMDVHLLSTGTKEEIRARTRRLIEVCGERGRFAVGSGNSIPSYVSAENYLVMVAEALDQPEY
ncbi:MAG TPA: uroporphyrinogen decarboxylase family protein [Longilinea sp.]|nr:uroporphyrinogen decarboxylase family protein [Longilinea sp.]